MGNIGSIGSNSYVDNTDAWRKLEDKAVQDAAMHKIEQNLSDTNQAIQKAGDPDADPNDPNN